MDMNLPLPVVKIKNVSGEDYSIVEVGGYVLADQEEMNLLDPNIEGCYRDYHSVRRLIQQTDTAQLYQDIQTGKVQVTLMAPADGMDWGDDS